MFDLTTIGEGQLRLTVPRGARLSRTAQLRVSAACSEANVAGMLAQLGHRTSWCSRLPSGDLADRCLSEYRAVGVDMSCMLRVDEGRMALYFMEPGTSPLPSKVTYDRLHTPFRDLTIDMIDWDVLLDTRMVLVTGITAALTDGTASVVRHFVDQATSRGVDVALDVNYRSLLWGPERAREVLAPIAEQSTILFCSRADAEGVFGVTAKRGESPRRLRETLGARHVVTTDRTLGVYYSGPGGECEFPVRVVPAVDRPGAGDAFVAGTIDGFLAGDVLAGVRRGQVASMHALTHDGDLTHVTSSELMPPETSDILR